MLVDAAGGATVFADSAERELGATFGPVAIRTLTQSLPVDHPVFTVPNGKITAFRYRTFTRPAILGNVPRLKGIQVAGRTAVLFSREDLTAGMVGQEVDGIFGYTPATATAIVRNIALYATGRPLPATQPSTQPAPANTPDIAERDKKISDQHPPQTLAELEPQDKLRVGRRSLLDRAK